MAAPRRPLLMSSGSSWPVTAQAASAWPNVSYTALLAACAEMPGGIAPLVPPR